MFFANPKTGTTALETALLPHATIAISDDPDLKHIGVKRFERDVQPFLKKVGIESKLDSFGVMRDPIDWLGSWYRYRQRDYDIGTEHSTRHVSFDDFACAYLDKENRPIFAKIGSPLGILHREGGKIGVDHLYAYEDLDLLVKELSQRLNTELSIKARINASPQLALELRNETREKLEHRFKKDIAIYAEIKR